VGVFGPLASSWRKQVTVASRQHIQIRKTNFLEHYSKARAASVTTNTIVSGFVKTGIYPFNPDIIPEVAYEPAKNTTTQAAPTLPATLPTILELTGTTDANGSEGAPSYDC
jgi:hypothetical protein